MSAETEMRVVETQLAAVPNRSIVLAGKELGATLEPMLRKNQLDLIVLKTGGRTGLTKLALGSKAEEVFRRSPVTVLTIGPSMHGDQHQGAHWELHAELPFSGALRDSFRRGKRRSAHSASRR